MTSKIEWTEETWNPITGCTKISAGCQNCYAEVMAKRLQAMGTKGYENGFKLNIRPDRLSEPIKNKKPTVYFVNSMSDLFHEKVSYDFIDKVFETIKNTPRHKYQILTKRAGIMADYFSTREVPENAWIGVTVEDIKHGVPRIDFLRNIKAKIRFVSIEPLLEDLGNIDLTNIHWIIVGGESGNRARAMKEEWALNIKKQCELEDVAFFFKQWGTWGADNKKRSKKANGRTLEGKTWNAMPDLIIEKSTNDLFL